MYYAFCSLREFIVKNPIERNLFMTHWEGIIGNQPGSIHALKFIVEELGWKHTGNWKFERDNDIPLDMLNSSKGLWQHELRRSLRFLLVRRLVGSGNLRKDMRGLKLIHPNKTPYMIITGETKQKPLTRLVQECWQYLGGVRNVHPSEVGVIVSGSLRTGDRLMKAKLWEDAKCPFCGYHKEEPLHFWSQCIATQFIRDQHQVKDLPNYSLCLGLFSEPSVVYDRRLYLLSIQAPEPPHEMFYELRRACVWTDGACRNQGLCEIRMAGWGLFSDSDTRVILLYHSQDWSKPPSLRNWLRWHT